MFQPKTILCPVDFSEPSDLALTAGRDLAGQFRSSIVLLHSVPPVPPLYGGGAVVNGGFDTAVYQQEMRESSARALAELKEGLPPEIVSETLLVDGDPAQEICRAAKDKKVDLIVIATHGQTGWRRLVFGSVTEKVVRLAPCPVLTIPAPREG